MQAPTPAPPPEALYADLAAIPTVTAGFIVRGAAQGSEGASPRVLLRRNQKDLAYDEARSHLMQFSSAPTQGGFSAQPFPTELRDVGSLVPSPCGQLLALVRSRTVNSKKEQSIEIWNGDMLVASVKANAELHGEIYAGDVFASFEWSPDSSALLYVAEAPAAKSGVSPAHRDCFPLSLPLLPLPQHSFIPTRVFKNKRVFKTKHPLHYYPGKRTRAHTHTQAHAQTTQTRTHARTNTHTYTHTHTHHTHTHTPWHSLLLARRLCSRQGCGQGIRVQGRLGRAVDGQARLTCLRPSRALQHCQNGPRYPPPHMT